MSTMSFLMNGWIKQNSIYLVLDYLLVSDWIDERRKLRHSKDFFLFSFKEDSHH